MRIARVIGGIAAGTLLAAGAGWLGLKTEPKSPPPHPETTKDIGTVGLPPDLPAPVQRHFSLTVGERVPLIESAVTWGRARLRISGVWLWATFKAYYIPGTSFYRVIKITWFGRPVLTGIDTYIHGRGTVTIAGAMQAGEKIDSASNLGLWAESIWMPSIFVTDPRVRWEAVDDITAVLIVPYDGQEEHFTVNFNLETGLIAEMRTRRYRDQESEKTPWTIKVLQWENFHGVAVPARATVTWEDEGSPWAEFVIDGVEYNVDVSERLPEA